MSDFDIASTQNGPSFLESLKRRKAFGLDESDEEDAIILKKTSKTKSKKQKKISKSTQQEDTTTTASHTDSSPLPPAVAAASSNINPYLASDIELDTTPFIAPTPTPTPNTNTNTNTKYNTQSTDAIIDLSDEADEDLLSDIVIEDLDPDLAALSHSIPGMSAQPEKIVVKLKYTHNFNFENLSASSKRSIQFLERPVEIKAMDNTEFRIILTSFCAAKKFLKMQDVYLTYNDDIVFLSGTPASVGMRPTATNRMEVYPKKCYDNMLAAKAEQKQKERMRHLAVNENDLFGDVDDDSILNAAESSSVNASLVDQERFRLNLRTSDKKTVLFRVKHTTTLRELVDAFKMRAEVSGDVQLSFEGETLDLDEAIQDTDLEDQDIVEVITN